MKKSITSRTFWFNLICGGVYLYNALTGRAETPAAIAVALLPWINIVLRKVTKEPVNWSGDE